MVSTCNQWLMIWKNYDCLKVTSKTHLPSGSSDSVVLGSSVWASEKSRARLVSFFWKNFRESLLLFTGLPCVATLSPCRPGIFTAGFPVIVFYSAATATPTGQKKEIVRFQFRGRHQSSTRTNVATQISLWWSYVTTSRMVRFYLYR